MISSHEMDECQDEPQRKAQEAPQAGLQAMQAAPGRENTLGKHTQLQEHNAQAKEEERGKIAYGAN